MAKKRKIVKKTKEAKPKLSKKQIKKPLKKIAKSKAKKNTSSLKKVRKAVHSPGLPKQVRPKRAKAELKKITVAYNESELAKYKEYKKSYLQTTKQERKIQNDIINLRLVLYCNGVRFGMRLIIWTGIGIMI